MRRLDEIRRAAFAALRRPPRESLKGVSSCEPLGALVLSNMTLPARFPGQYEVGEAQLAPECGAPKVCYRAKARRPDVAHQAGCAPQSRDPLAVKRDPSARRALSTETVHYTGRGDNRSSYSRGLFAPEKQSGPTHKIFRFRDSGACFSPSPFCHQSKT